ncbi:MAG: anthranilate synthase component I family protein [Chitinophagaceae bacterium]|nr:anthranilate synthase component I family protein [Chitinophagaceae bacterium]
MTRKFISFPIADPQQTKSRMLNWGNRFNICCFLDNHKYHLSHTSIECVVAAGALHNFSANAGSALAGLASFRESHNDWVFGHLSYDLKNEIEALSSSNFDGIGFPDLSFFVPKYILQLNESSVTVGSCDNDHESIFHDLINADAVRGEVSVGPVDIKSRFTRKQYIDTVEHLRRHILRGDCYEINLCQEFYVENIRIDPLQLYNRLSSASPNPFSAFYKLNDLYLACMSPERYLRREGTKILSQPMKGTSPRYVDDPGLDEHSRRELENSDKERAENIMVVDLVRNDLSRICVQGSVNVDELCAVYSFPNVHQMISTVSGELAGDVDFVSAIKATFPMGSMTGAPKKKVMELIERYELTKRGLFSGSLGYIEPSGDFDLNVVIRSVLYNSSEKYLSFHAGSAITFGSNAELEYEECLLKAAAIKKALAETNTFH